MLPSNNWKVILSKDNNTERPSTQIISNWGNNIPLYNPVVTVDQASMWEKKEERKINSAFTDHFEFTI